MGLTQTRYLVKLAEHDFANVLSLIYWLTWGLATWRALACSVQFLGKYGKCGSYPARKLALVHGNKGKPPTDPNGSKTSACFRQAEPQPVLQHRTCASLGCYPCAAFPRRDYALNCQPQDADG